MMKKTNAKNTATLICAACIILAVFSAGCSPPGSGSNSPEYEAAQSETLSDVEKVDPAAAADAIYGSLEESSAKRLSGAEVQKIVGIAFNETLESYIYYSDPIYGLADIMLIKPAEGFRDEVRRKLYSYKEARIAEFERYDILNACQIAKDALIYDQGEYIVLLMLDDADSAKAIIDEYIPL